MLLVLLIIVFVDYPRNKGSIWAPSMGGSVSQAAVKSLGFAVSALGFRVLV